ncbi:class A beta-lactamase-related serine hydrolase [Brevibacillus nitrificans]|uniref:Class A beta-lactamase-related serine hydrolase n=1 Tax=Brevibacillus nitrificans TaxID=651560 RepID=A0A3M8DKI9_9BACL|nr:serine hydrolase domain-containing protein [Brevibacillus nitrificans]RNB88600.1 class A beta-lactamase-related serine hydrolase [Brevibacillus nitrificans]
MSLWKQPPAKELTAEVDKKIVALMETYQIVGVSAAVVKENQVVWANEYGWSDLDREIAVTEDTVFRIASISKLFVATSLMQQYEKGKFQLDDDISDCLGFSFRNPHHPDVPITFRQLLTHTTSLHEDETGGELYVVFSKASRQANPPTMEDLLVPGGSLYVDSLWSSFKPGDPQCFAYSNLASMIVAALVERMSGERFDQYCRDHILRPLGMTASDFHVQALADINKLGVIYSLEEEQFIAGVDDCKGVKPESIDWSNVAPGTNGSLFGPQGGLRTNARELSKFMMAIMRGGSFNGARILQPETVELMLSTQWAQEGVDQGFQAIGLQFHITDECIPAKRMFGHGGSAYGLYSGLYFSREEDFGIIFVTNGSHASAGTRGSFNNVEEALIDTLYEEIVKE